MWCRYGYPALVALSPSKLKFAALRSAYELDAVKTFVNHVRQVRQAALDAAATRLKTLIMLMAVVELANRVGCMAHTLQGIRKADTALRGTLQGTERVQPVHGDALPTLHTTGGLFERIGPQHHTFC